MVFSWWRFGLTGVAKDRRSGVLADIIQKTVLGLHRGNMNLLVVAHQIGRGRDGSLFW